MPGADGSDEPNQHFHLIGRGYAADKQTAWKTHIETFHHHHAHNHHYHESVSTSASDSANSSPTTTASTVDDSSATEMSPGSSPESPLGKPFPSSYTTLRTRPSTSGNERTLQPALIPDQRPTTPGRRPRNLKNLAVNTSGSLHAGQAASTGLPMRSMSEDNSNMNLASMSFSKPPSPPKRRPTNLGLTILTPASSQALPQNVRIAVPATPAFSRPNMLRHFQSSPSLPLHSSRLLETADAIIDTRSPPAQQLSAVADLKSDDSEPNFDVPLSKEEKPAAYPDGPICVYGPRLDLYLEPTAEQASYYDVVINVASEVRNPFEAHKAVEPEPEIRLDGGGGIQYAPRRSQVTVSKPDAQHDALSPVIESSPTTPKASPSTPALALGDPWQNSKQLPEYIHIPWEHNTDIVPDTLRLVKVIDERIKDKKRVLIHCQCGVSRSATLVVAYVIYKNPNMSVQEAYDTVKRKSKWIGPNMNLIMQLQEFRSALLRPMARLARSRGLSPISPSIPQNQWGLPGPHADDDGSSPPMTAPLPAQDRTASTLVVSGDLAVGAGPSSAPSGIKWPNHEDSISGKLQSQDAAYVDPAGHIVPVVKVIEDPHSSSPVIAKTPKDRPRSLNLDSHTRHDSGRHISPMGSPRSFEFAMTPLQPPKEVDSADTFGLLSPTASDFPHSPWDRDALLGSLGMGPAIQHGPTQPHRVRPLQPSLSPDQQAHVDGQRSLPIRPQLRPKLSAPSLQEQRELQDMQSRLEVELGQKSDHHNAEAAEVEAALSSPRAYEFTQNPFALITDEPKNNLSVPEAGDPRSPPQRGVSPITRSIFDVL
ncbi:hypothetical protein AAFC00_004628 [Neodothiora populina]|uniref:protein-tyrosine-phosphatase n=1 Tax=Neodothiora populina TaxID=2781224 RepID=A0ABR3P3F4_9PEZI